jgi:hypothetical protein
MSIEQTLAERQLTHGDFETHAYISQKLKAGINLGGFKDMQPDQKEALEMIVHKIARILNGNPDTHDHWHDIAGYATLVANRLKT